jgi:hypothetical protein
MCPRPSGSAVGTGPTAVATPSRSSSSGGCPAQIRRYIPVVVSSSTITAVTNAPGYCARIHLSIDRYVSVRLSPDRRALR